MKKFIVIFICLFSCIISNAQLNATKVVETRVTVSKIGNNAIVSDPKLGYVLAVRGTTALYLIELGKTKESAKETIKDLICIGNNEIFTESTMFGSLMYIYGDMLSSKKVVVRFKDPKMAGSAYISVEQLEQFYESW